MYIERSGMTRAVDGGGNGGRRANEKANADPWY